MGGATFYEGVLTSRAAVEIEGLTVRFRMSYDRITTIAGAVRELGKRVWYGWEPEYFTALRAVTFRVEEGEIVGIIGANGSGKSTLLRAIAGIYTPDEGIVRVKGRVSALLSVGAGFDLRLTGLDNIRLVGLIHGLSDAEIDALIPRIVEFANIGKFVQRPMKYYSTGMISRLGFSMILAMQPDILLVDETLSVGDLAFQEKSNAAMRELMARARCQILVSHDLPLLERTCTRAIWLDKGQVMADGEPRHVTREYRSHSVRGQRG